MGFRGSKDLVAIRLASTVSDWQWSREVASCGMQKGSDLPKKRWKWTSLFHSFRCRKAGDVPLGNSLPFIKEAVETRTNTDTKAFLQFCLLLVWSPSIFHKCFCHGSHSRYQCLWDSSVFSVCLETAASPGHLTICSAGSRVQTMSLSLCLSTLVLLSQLALPSVDTTYTSR